MAIKAAISAIRPTGGNHDHHHSAEVTTPNLARISVRSGGREQLRTSAKSASKGFIGLVVSAPSGEKLLNGHLGWSRAMLL
ncbi:hypothetical protein Taro_048703 [Colocasia esculenta]|uniref:Uncharacterized protein n=1 Tax=Colocasia esculenta TaxID=4460 RepID=A0A843X8V8_COLES|nr:hypothetical protein [Colocasia esculenta]